jgi:hypothetical protein
MHAREASQLPADIKMYCGLRCKTMHLQAAHADPRVVLVAEQAEALLVNRQLAARQVELAALVRA